MNALGKTHQGVLSSAAAPVDRPQGLPPLPPRAAITPLFEVGRVDRLSAERFQAAPGMPGILIRTIEAAERYSDGKVIGRMLKRDSSSEFGNNLARIQSPGIKIIFILMGWASIEIEGLGEQRLKAGTLISLPPRNRHRFTDVAPNFEDIEYELPSLIASAKSSWSAQGATNATSEMIDAESIDSFKNIPNFLGGVYRQFPIVKKMTGGAVSASMLRANPPHVWSGTPWHIHHHDFYCALRTKGSGMMHYEGVGDVVLNTGDFLIQQGGVRHREVIMSLDYETFVIDLPGTYPTTMFIYDKAQGEYNPIMFTSAQDSAKAMD